MASESARMGYQGASTYGSSAYDLSSFDNAAFPETYDLPEETVDTRELEWERQQERAAAIREAKATQSVSIAAVMGFAVVFVLLLLVVLSGVKLIEISAEISDLKDTLSEVQTTQVELKVQYESTFNLTEIEEYSTRVLGMTKLSDSNTTVLSIERDDMAEVLAGNTSGSGIIATAKEFISSLLEYFD